jgi:serine protease SohB
MHDFLTQYGLFLAKTVTLFAVAFGLIVMIAGAVRASRQPGGGERLEVKNLNDRFEDLADALKIDVLSDAEFKQLEKQRKADDKARRKAEKKGTAEIKPRLFVLDFDGDIEASQVHSLREEISAVLQVAKPEDSVLLRLESGGGVVHGYGLAASQLKRIRDRGHRLVVSVDKIAASGGYMMACVADEVVAAPFAILGSIGVVAQLPNFHRLLDKNAIDVELHTAGEYKRTLTMFGENTEAARVKFRQELDEIHSLFKSFVSANRPKLDLARVATGEHWYGTQALELGLVDTLRTSDDLLMEQVKTHDVYEVHYKARRGLREQLLSALTRIARPLQTISGLAAALLNPPGRIQ